MRFGVAHRVRVAAVLNQRRVGIRGVHVTFVRVAHATRASAAASAGSALSALAERTVWTEGADASAGARGGRRLGCSCLRCLRRSGRLSGACSLTSEHSGAVGFTLLTLAGLRLHGSSAGSQPVSFHRRGILLLGRIHCDSLVLLSQLSCEHRSHVGAWTEVAGMRGRGRRGLDGGSGRGDSDRRRRDSARRGGVRNHRHSRIWIGQHRHLRRGRHHGSYSRHRGSRRLRRRQHRHGHSRGRRRGDLSIARCRRGRGRGCGSGSWSGVRWSLRTRHGCG